MELDRDGFRIIPDAKADPNNIVAGILGGHPVGGPQPAPEGEKPPRTKAIQDRSGDADSQYVLHARNFLDCIKTRKEPPSDVLSGHQIATACHLSNIAMLVGRTIRWDPEKEAIIGDEEAARMLERPYRSPWDAEIRAAGVR